jgi:uncharacterized membrane protein YfcA
MNWLKSLAVSIFAILAPIHTVMATVAVLIALDLVSGIWAALKRKEIITSAVLRRTVSKMIAYQLAVISGFLVEQFLLQGSIPVIKLIASAIGLVEMKSILENADAINQQPLFAALIKKFGSDNEPKKDESQNEQPK